MLCDHQLIVTHVSELLDGTLPEVLRLRCETAQRECAECRAVVEQAQQWASLAHHWQDEAVPRWHRNRHLVREQPRPTPAWLSWGALAVSLIAAFLVATRAELSTTNGLVISFGGSLGEQRVQQLVANELAASAVTQAALLDARLLEFSEQQLVANRLLYAEWQQENRLERRQDLGLLLSGWQNQRQQDQQTYAARFSELSNDQIESNQTLSNLVQAVARPGRSGL
jgi:hypothetical protein